MKVAAIYARKSTEQVGVADDAKSVARQVENARAFAEANGFSVADEHIYVDDGVSGAAALAKLRSKGRLLADIDAGPKFTALIMQARDRFSRRDGDEAFGEMKAIDRAGVTIWFYGDNTKFEHGSFASNTLGFLNSEFVAEWRRAIAAKTAEAMLRKARQGHVTGGRVFGYDIAHEALHKVRRVNAAEAAVVLRIYELYAAGAGLAGIAHRLNADAAPSPRAQQGRPSGWCSSSVREVVKRDIYRGLIVYGRSRKRDKAGQIAPTRRPPSEWVRVEAPELRVVPAALADAVDARLDSMRKRSLRLSNGSLMGRPPGEGSKYLLNGVATCGVCGGSMEVLSSTSGKRRVFTYKCRVARRKGPACCTNAQAVPMEAADEAVLKTIEQALMHPKVVERALVHAERAIARSQSADERGAVEASLGATNKAMARLSTAIAQSDDLQPLLPPFRRRNGSGWRLRRGSPSCRTRRR